VHCWTEDGFLLVLDHGVRSLGHHWEFVDGVLSDDEGPDGMEFGFVLRRSPVALDPEVAASRFQAAYEQWAGQRRALHAALDAPAPGPAAPAGLLTRLWRRLD
jgi:hypothetical protein